jgi:hypothetical protein
MSIDYENRARIFNAGIEGSFKEMAGSLAVDAERIREVVVAAYTKDLSALDARGRIVDDVLAIMMIGSIPENDLEGAKYRKIYELFRSKGLLPKDA